MSHLAINGPWIPKWLFAKSFCCALHYHFAPYVWTDAGLYGEYNRSSKSNSCGCPPSLYPVTLRLQALVVRLFLNWTKLNPLNVWKQYLCSILSKVPCIWFLVHVRGGEGRGGSLLKMDFHNWHTNFLIYDLRTFLAQNVTASVLRHCRIYYCRSTVICEWQMTLTDGSQSTFFYYY